MWRADAPALSNRASRLGLSCKASACSGARTGDLGVLTTHETLSWFSLGDAGSTRPGWMPPQVKMGHSKNKSVPPSVAEKSEPANFWDVSTSERKNNLLSKSVVQSGLFEMKLELIGPWVYGCKFIRTQCQLVKNIPRRWKWKYYIRYTRESTAWRTLLHLYNCNETVKLVIVILTKTCLQNR